MAIAGSVAIFEQAPSFRPLRTDAYEALREAILLGQLRPGERVVEAEIARQMGISRGPIREAVRQLEQDGLVEYQPRRGVIVAELTRERVLDAYAVRAQLEGLASRLAAEHIVPAGLAHLETLLETMRTHADADDATALLQTDVQFHEYVCTVAGNRVLLRLWTSLGPHAWTLFSGAQQRGHTTLVALADRHQPIIDALRSRDVDEAERVGKEHTLGIARGVLDHLHTLGGQDGLPPTGSGG